MRRVGGTQRDEFIIHANKVPMSCGERLRLDIQLPIGIYIILSPMFGGEVGLPTTCWSRADHPGGGIIGMRRRWPEGSWAIGNRAGIIGIRFRGGGSELQTRNQDDEPSATPGLERRQDERSRRGRVQKP